MTGIHWAEEPASRVTHMVTNVEIVAATPAGLMEDAYDRRIRETHFRPRLIDGAPLPTSGVRFTHNFRYYVAEEED